MAGLPPSASSVRASLAWSYGAHLLVFAVTFGGIVVVSRLLTPRELGIFGVGFAIAGVLSAVSQFGVANFLIRERQVTPQTAATCFTVNALISLAIAAALLLLSTLGSGLFDDPAIPQVLRLLALMPVFALFEIVPAALMTRAMRFGPLSLLQLGKACANAGVTVAAAYGGWSYLSPALGTVAGAAFGALGFSLVGRHEVALRLSLKGGREVLVFALHIMSTGGIPVLTARLAELTIAQVLGLAALGVYTRASQLAAIVWDGAYGLSTRVIYVQMAADMREIGSLRETFLRATRLLSAAMWPAMAGIAVLAGPIVHRIYGPQWDAAALPLAMLMIAQCIGIAYAMAWELCVLSERTAWQARMEAGRAVIGLAALFVGALVSLPVAAASRVFDQLVGFTIYRPKMSEMAGVSAAEARLAHSGNALVALVAIAPAALLMSLRGWSFDTPLAELAGAIALGVSFWLAALAATRHPLFDELKAVTTRR